MSATSPLRKPIRKSGRPPTEADLVFVEDYLKYGNATHAYHAAGFNGVSPGTNALKMLKKAGIQALLRKANARVLRRVANKMEITVDKVLGDIETARVTALNAHPAPQCAAAIKASELHGRHIGMFREDYNDQAQAPTIIIKTLGGAQIAIIGKDQEAAMRPLIPHNDVDEVLTDDDFL